MEDFEAAHRQAVAVGGDFPGHSRQVFFRAKPTTQRGGLTLRTRSALSEDLTASLSCFNKAQLAIQAPAVAAQTAVTPNHSVARNDDGYGVGCASAGHGPGCRGLAEGLGYLSVGASAPVGDGLQLLPDTPLKGGGLNIQRKVEVGMMTAQMIHDLLHPTLQAKIVTADLGRGILLGEGSFQDAVIVSQIDRRDAAVGRAHEQPAERTRDDGVPDSCVEAAAPIGGRRHAELTGSLFVEPTAGAITCFEERHGDGPPFFEPSLEPA